MANSKRLIRLAAPVVMDRVRFLLRDDFNDTLAAGGVHGTLATPGGRGTVAQKTRTVVDTAGDKLSITGGRLVSAGRTGAADPVLYYGPFTRVGGLTAKWLHRWVTARSAAGWTNVVPNPTNPAIGPMSFSGQLTTAYPNTATYNILATGIDYTVWATLFMAGGAVWVQGGAYTNPTLLWLEDSLFITAGNMYFYPQITTSTDCQIQSDNVQIDIVPGLATPAQLARVYIATPMNGVNYATVADAIHMLKFALPGSPSAGNKIELRYRYQDVDNYWTAYVIYNGGTSQWDFMVDEVLAGATTNKITVANVGAATLRKIVVVATGNTHYYWTEHTTYYERRGAVVTDADLITATEVGAWFNAGTTVNLGSYPRTWSL